MNCAVMVRRCVRRRWIIPIICVISTVISIVISKHNLVWWGNHGKIASDVPVRDLPFNLVTKMGPPKTRYEDPLRELIELVSPKDPNCRPDKSTADPYSQLDTATFTSLAKILLSYRQQHIRWRKLLLEGKVKKIRTLTWYCDSWCGGLGDRVKGIGLSLTLAMISNRLLLVQWKQPFRVERQKNIFEPAAIDWNLDQALADKLQKLSTASVRMNSWTSSTREQRAHLIEDYIASSEHRHLRIKSNIHFNNLVDVRELVSNRIQENYRFQILTNAARADNRILPRVYPIHGVLTRYLFKFSPPVLEKAQELAEEMNMSDTKQYVVANVRSGFLGTLNEISTMMAVTPHQWEAIVDRAVTKSKQLGANVPVLLCTDSDKVKSWARKHYNGTVKSIPWKPIHIGRIFKNVDDKSNAEIETVAEVVIMSRASFLFKTFNNGFTSVAVYMCPFLISCIP